MYDALGLGWGNS
ncbi:hypothetical protein BN1708_018195, partial [Verticillium longisporum]